MTTVQSIPKVRAGQTTASPRQPRPIGASTPRRIPLRPRDIGARDVGLLAATILSSFCVVWILFQLTLLSGPVGFVACWVALFLPLYWVVNLQINTRQVAADRLLAAVLSIAGIAMFAPLIWITVYVFLRGWRLISWHLLTATQKGAVLVGSGPAPGIAHAIVGTVEQVTLATIFGVPLAILTAIFLNEIGGRITGAVRVVVTAMTGVPAIVAGVFIYSMWIITFGFGYSGLAGAMALTVILLPTVTRGTEEVLKVVPNDLREASTALAAPEWRTVLRVVLPTARSGLVTAILLGIAVAVGETAPLLLTIFGNDVMNANPFSQPQAALPLLAWDEFRLPSVSAKHLAFAASLVLFMLVFFLFILGRILGSSWASRGISNRMRARMANAAARGTAAEGPVIDPEWPNEEGEEP